MSLPHISLAIMLAMLTPCGRATAAGQADLYDLQRYKNCMEATQAIPTPMGKCTRAEIKRQDRRLNRSYRKVMAGLDADKKARLRAAERTWIGERDTRCAENSEAAPNGSTRGMVVSYACILEETIARAEWLEAYRP